MTSAVSSSSLARVLAAVHSVVAFVVPATAGVSAVGLLVAGDIHAQAPPPQIVLGATTEERREAARALVPLLTAVKAHARPGVEVAAGGAPPSRLTGRPSTLFAFTVSKKQVPVDPRVVAAMDRLQAWNLSTPGVDDQAAVFDRWLMALQSRTAASNLLAGGAGVCDLTCVVTRMTTLDERWGRAPNGRADARDELLLEAMTAAVTTQP